VDVSSSSPEFGEARETLPVDYSGEAMQICFNAQYVLDFPGGRDDRCRRAGAEGRGQSGDAGAGLAPRGTNTRT